MKLPKQKLLASLTLIFALAFFFAPLATLAATDTSVILPECAATGACRFCDMVNVFITLGKWLIAASGGLALLMIVWAGVSMATSAGNPEKITAAKKNIGGAILGLGAVLAAFQFVSILVGFVTLPSSSETFQQSQTPDASTIGNASLGRFLGIPWWQICSDQELQMAGAKYENNKEYKGTGVCRYWGDNTPCSPEDANGQAAKRCCRGACGVGECTAIIVPEEIKQTITPIRPPAQTIPSHDTSGWDEATVREYFVSRGGRINHPENTTGCPIGVRYQNYPGGCTSVAGLNQSTLDTLIAANNTCNKRCVLITGGTELGHDSHGLGKQVVDVDYLPGTLTALENAGVLMSKAQRSNSYKNFERGYTCERCLTVAGITTCGPIDCNLAQWVHVEF